MRAADSDAVSMKKFQKSEIAIPGLSSLPLPDIVEPGAPLTGRKETIS
jgi:hypothetical protein